MEIDKNSLRISSASLGKIALHYFSHLNRKNIDIREFNVFEKDEIEDDGEKNVRFILRRYASHLGMYGSSKELTENLHIFANFPQNEEFLQIDRGGPYSNDLEAFEGTDGQKYIHKQDIFLYLQNRLILKEPRLKKTIPKDMLCLFLKSQEKKVNEGCEFIRFDEKTFCSIDKELDEIIRNLKKLPRLCRPLSLKKYEWRHIFDQFKKVLPEALVDVEQVSLAGAVRIAFEEIPTNKRTEDWQLFYTISASLIRGLHSLMRGHPGLFLPAKSSNKTVVRLFEDGSQKFVIRFELEQAMSSLNPRVRVTDVFDRNRMECMTLDEANEFCKSHQIEITKLSFVKIPVKRAKHRAVPILTPYKYHCILSIDVLFEFLRDFYFERSIFHGTPCGSPMVIHIVGKLNTFFDTSFPYRYLSSIGSAHHLDAAFDINSFGNKAHLHIRDVGSNGFTVEELIDEIEYLGFDSSFPEIFSHVDIAYEEVLKNKREHFLRKCDMYDAIEHCLHLCLFNRFPNMAEFLHIQKACHRIVGYNCEKCSSEHAKKQDQRSIDVYELLEKNMMRCKEEKEKKDMEDKIKAEELANSGGESKTLKIKNKKKAKAASQVVATGSQQGSDVSLAAGIMECLNLNTNIVEEKNTESADEKNGSQGKAAENSDHIEMTTTPGEGSSAGPSSSSSPSNENHVQEDDKPVQDNHQSDPPNSIKWCIKCHRTSLKCDAAKEELKSASKKITDLKKELSAFQRRNTEKSTTISEQELVIKSLEAKLKIAEDLNEKSNIAKTAEEIKKNEAKLLEKDEIIALLQEKLKVTEHQNEQREETISNLLNELQSASAGTSSDIVVVKEPSKNASSLSEELSNELFSLFKTRGTLLNANLIHQATDSVNKLLLLTEKEPIKRRARIELKKFHDAYRNYMRAIEENIETIQASYLMISQEFTTKLFKRRMEFQIRNVSSAFTVWDLSINCASASVVKDLITQRVHWDGTEPKMNVRLVETCI
ncbi:hypothetical protein CRE_27197 [Caenorhabditis remanei]|uniref:DUF7809 domain-containing protein n=1 Tax=Caenorhabditis remanei TaxID=31234 RepID=E3LP00_CAERE|nr:hypothetical protein CRE_27197 [Caenorhabditis remanei]